MTRDSIDIEDFLSKRGIKLTPNRILVAKELIKTTHPVSLADLEILLDPMDKASIFRVLELYAGKDIVHVIEDGSRSSKYEICLSSGHHSLRDQHVHFFCEKCRETYCFENTAIPIVEMPDGFLPRAVNYVIKGLCPTCRRKEGL
ncbi:MAG: transcriptional repressor [Muribaculaceae bacterium]|nr:transcriptional repressor [Muribaculaceae bacterium]